MQESRRPTGAANDRRQSLRSVDIRPYCMSVATVPGRTSADDIVYRHTCLSPTRIMAGSRRMSSSTAVPLSPARDR